jgi:biopolymer transport protein ExbD
MADAASQAETDHDPRPSRVVGRGRIALNLTAMIDVVFLLLIYFMVATEFKLGEEVYRLDLPARAGVAQQRDPFQLDEQPLRIAVASTGPGRSAYRLSLDGPYPQPASFEALYEFLRKRQIGENAAGGLFALDHPIIIEPSRATRWDHAIEAFNAPARARYTNVTFAPPR